MEYAYAKVSTGVVCLNDRSKLVVHLGFKSSHGSCGWEFVFSNPADVHRLEKLMSYTGSYDFDQLNGKIVRQVIHRNTLRGFGDIMADKFVPLFGEEFSEISGEQFEELLNKK